MSIRSMLDQRAERIRFEHELDARMKFETDDALKWRLNDARRAVRKSAAKELKIRGIS